MKEEIKQTEYTPEQHVFDQEEFERVWSRVMPEKREDCPILPCGEAPDKLHAHKEEHQETHSAPPRHSTALQQESQNAVCGLGCNFSVYDKRAKHPPRASASPRDKNLCFGPQSHIYCEKLHEFIQIELAKKRHYLYLEQRFGRFGGTFWGVARTASRNAKRLITAHFLISGIHFKSDIGLPKQKPKRTSYLSELRECFGKEQEGEYAYRTAARETHDACLQQLYLEIAKTYLEHARLLRGILEQL